MSAVLGISAYFHDSSACLVVDGTITAAIAEERLSRVKHDASFPKLSIDFCLEKSNLTISEVDEVVFFEKPLTKFERILESYLKVSPTGFLPFQKAVKSWLKEKLWVEDTFRRNYGYKGIVSYCQHHMAHAANAAYQSGFEDACYLIIDGVGEKACTSFGTFENGVLTPHKEQYYPHSIGLLYSAFTYYCGFKVNSGEYKLMGLAPYGTPKYVATIEKNIVTQQDDASIHLNLDYFSFHKGLKMINSKFENLFGHPARSEGDEMTTFYKDIAASIQVVTESLVMRTINHVLKATNKSSLIYGGGVALNCVLNGKIKEQTTCENVFIHSSSGDSGCAIGAALWAYGLENSSFKSTDNLEFTGPCFSNDEIHQSIRSFSNLVAHQYEYSELYKKTAQYLNDGKVVGWFQDAMEMGPRALGNRSILAHPGIENMKQILNVKIKKREGFRPFAPVILDHAFDDYFENGEVDYSKMLYTTSAKIKAPEITASVHEDNSARVQKLRHHDNPHLYQLLSAFNKVSGFPILINTSLNERGEPIVCSPLDAIYCFLNTEMDVLVMGNFLMVKTENQGVNFKKRGYEMD